MREKLRFIEVVFHRARKRVGQNHRFGTRGSAASATLDSGSPRSLSSGRPSAGPGGFGRNDGRGQSFRLPSGERLGWA